MPAAPTSGSFVDTAALSIREILPEVSLVKTMQDDPIYKDLVVSNAGLVPLGQIGRDLLFHRRFVSAAGGVIRGGNMNDYQGLYGAQAVNIVPDGTSDRGLASDIASGNLMLNALGTSVPDPMNGASGQDYGITFPLHCFEGNVALSLEESETENLPANTREYTTLKIKGMAQLVSQFMTNSFYSNSENNNRLGSFPATVAAGDIFATSRMVVCRLVEMTSARFQRGMEVDVWPSTFPTSGNRINQETGTTTNTSEADRVKCWVHDVDDMNNTVTLVFYSAANDGGTFTFGTNVTTTTLASAFITPANTYGGSTPGFAHFFGWRHFLKYDKSTLNGSVILGASAVKANRMTFIDIRDHAEHGSFHKSINGALTIRRLARIMAGVVIGLNRNGDMIDTFIGCPGLWLNMTEHDEGKETLELAGKPSNTSGRGVNTGGGLLFDGKRYAQETSMYLEDGFMLGVRRSGNFQFAVPPSAQGARVGGVLPNLNRLPIEWIVSALTGGVLQRIPMLASRSGSTSVGVAQASEMPYKVRGQLVPSKQIRGLVLDGITTSREFSSAA